MNNKKRKIVIITLIFALLVVSSFAYYYLKPLIEFRSKFEAFPVNAQGLKEYRHRKTNIIFVQVPKGSFVQKFFLSKTVFHLESFLISKHEVSQKQWQAIMGSNPAEFKGEQFPIENVSWEDCEDFCQRTGLSLPLHYQWEYACRAGTTTPYSFGLSITQDQVNFWKELSFDNRDKTLPVDSLEPNPWGLYNMHGNVAEWCGGLPKGFSDKARVYKGGSWSAEAKHARSDSRGMSNLSLSESSVGFRPVYLFDR